MLKITLHFDMNVETLKVVSDSRGEARAYVVLSDSTGTPYSYQ